MTVFLVEACKLSLMDMKYSPGNIKLSNGNCFEPNDPVTDLNSLALRKGLSATEVIMHGRILLGLRFLILV